jgi:phenylacetic acid degradation operon negative regulatory protein
MQITFSPSERRRSATQSRESLHCRVSRLIHAADQVLPRSRNVSTTSASRAASRRLLIISVFGDAVLPRGSRIWLGSLIRLLEPLELNERLIRTSVFRLAKEEWLRTEPRPAHRLPAHALRPAPLRGSPPHLRLQRPQWDRRWRLIVTVGELAPRSARPCAGLFWQGFGIGGDFFVHPSADLRRLRRPDGRRPGRPAGQAQAAAAADAQFGNAASDVDMVNGAWNLERLAGVYDGFVERYQPVLDALRADAAATSTTSRLPAAHC